MTPEVSAAVEPIIEEIGVQLDVLDSQGGRYVRDYLAHTMLKTVRPSTPRGMHPHIAKALREMALEQATLIRMYGPPKKRAGHTRQVPRRRKVPAS